VKGSALYDAYWAVVDKSLVEDVRREVEFYRQFLGGFRPGDLIFDIGANHGHKTKIFLRLGARVLAVDPDEANKEILEGTFIKYRLSPRHVEIVTKAVSDKNAVETMWFDTPGSAKNTISRKWVDILRSDDERFGEKLTFGQQKQVETVTLDDLIRTSGFPLFVKIDVEGHEPSVLKGLSRPVPYLSFEVNLPEFLSEGKECVDILRKLDGSGQFNHAIDCRQGFVGKQWLGAEQYSSVLDECQEKSIEIFWRSQRS
jgi:FkbM family methyltransferase